MTGKVIQAITSFSGNCRDNASVFCIRAVSVCVWVLATRTDSLETISSLDMRGSWDTEETRLV